MSGVLATSPQSRRIDRYEDVRLDLIPELRAAILAQIVLESATARATWRSADDLFTWRAPAVQELRRTLEIDFDVGLRKTARAIRGKLQKPIDLGLDQAAQLCLYEGISDNGWMFTCGVYCVEVGGTPLTILFDARSS